MVAYNQVAVLTRITIIIRETRRDQGDTLELSFKDLMIEIRF